MPQPAFKFELHGLKECMDALDQLPTLSMKRGVVRNALKKAAIPIKDRAKENAQGIKIDNPGVIAESVKIGTSLKKSQRGRTERDRVTVYVGSSHPLCIYGSGTVIATKGKSKKVGCVRVGDEVMTQTGEYKKVVAVQSFPATLKPNIVEITTEKHTLNVTEDHKILIHRDGRNKWVLAGELLETDKMYVRKKLGANKGTGKALICQNCGKEFRSGVDHDPQTKYCSMECVRDAFKGKLITCRYCRKQFRSNGKIGRQRIYCSRECYIKDATRKNLFSHTFSIESRKKMSEKIKARLLRDPESHPNKIMCKKGHQTEYEAKVEAWLKERGVKYEKQKQIGRYFVDFYVPEIQTIYEADGAYWHKNQMNDIKRDAGIKKVMPDAKIIHIHFYDERHSPENMDRTPLPDVHYVACNPGPNSYTNPEMIETQGIVSIKKWEYSQSRKGPASKLYDISVEGVHSFFANGLLVSNSHLFEFGTAERYKKSGAYTGYIPPMPFMREAWDSKKKVSLDILKEELWKALEKAAKLLAKKAARGTLTKKQIAGLSK
jgi:very-short-patch-repair endonuclease